ncbi:response regulator with CheY-like receiver domain and winged-helix DNA-binding domain [secondary endosymbiont of Ctenarytaina eucalypti]|uniref:Response regulator with CheY-like receiver domain and winged-helix DNA-binding domain n=1 Tax=secondary endosymbiont of Ctenarytaina eucalypti TaxID=1199245 RepID=J3TEZ0_9ENTR|nr:response regulator with CheY-like receiver domain and winged-helix DNA-binding domain [secondary endosymbiont of Ctenarytaina eucalypti]
MRRNTGLASKIIKLPPVLTDLSRRAVMIIKTLIRNTGKVVSKCLLMLQLYLDAELRESHAIDVLIVCLRKNMGQLPTCGDQHSSRSGLPF